MQRSASGCGRVPGEVGDSKKGISRDAVIREVWREPFLQHPCILGILWNISL